VAILPETNLDGAQAAGEKIRKAVETLDFPVDGKKVKITVSAGVSAFPLNASDKTGLIEAADEALYHAKEGGRNQVRVSERQPTKMVEEKAGESAEAVTDGGRASGQG
jgi:diguanylate cyclase (GGDEF)-like protein